MFCFFCKEILRIENFISIKNILGEAFGSSLVLKGDLRIVSFLTERILLPSLLLGSASPA